MPTSPSCKLCAAPVWWATTPAGKHLALNQSPIDEGTWVYLPGSGTHARPLTALELADEDLFRNRRFLPHLLTCSKANEFQQRSIEQAPRPVQETIDYDYPAPTQF